ncbi:MAG: PAS domain S-box protein [Chloroflexi bacterium]|nr:PAS domain S-box protein [Chloroflexota bacterium]
MENENKTKEQLAEELAEARKRISDLEILEDQRKQAEKALWESEKRFRSIAETASDAIIIFDTYENIFYWNQAAKDIFGYWAAETRGHLLASIMSEESCEIFKKEMDKVVETGESDIVGQAIEVTGVRKNGERFPLELSMGSWESNNEVFFTTIARDITERKRSAAAIQSAYEQVEKQVVERTSELQREIAERERLQEEVIDAQKRALEELSTPIIPLMERIIVMPLIGNIDSARARDITRNLLAGIRLQRAKIVILDITGVSVVDSGVADHLNRTIQAARLKGAHTIVSGISDAVAETIVDLGIDWEGIETLPNLQTGLLAALARMGRRIV